MIPESTIKEIRDRTDIQSVIESAGVSLNRSGSRLVGLCPFHNERTPSFYVNRDSGSFKCFGCGEGGDAITFIQKMDNLTFVGALEYLGELAGIEVKDDQPEDENYKLKKRLYACVKDAAWFYQNHFRKLDESHPAKANLLKRHYLHVENNENWESDAGFGYAPEGWDNLVNFLFSKGYSEKEIVEAGLAKWREDENGNKKGIYDFFRNRLLFTIRNIKGNPIAFSGRKLDEADKSAKYLNTAKTLLYDKSSTLYGLDIARKTMVSEKIVYVSEGAADALAIRATGKQNSVASCGTAFGSNHAAIIRRLIDDYNTKENGKFVFVFDGDKAGINAAKKMFDLKPSISDRSYVVIIDEGMDPVDFRVKYGDEKLKEALDRPTPITEFMLEQLASKYDLERIEDKASFASEALELISHIDNPMIYDEYRKKVGFMVGFSVEKLGRMKSFVPTKKNASLGDIDSIVGDSSEDSSFSFSGAESSQASLPSGSHLSSSSSSRFGEAGANLGMDDGAEWTRDPSEDEGYYQSDDDVDPYSSADPYSPAFEMNDPFAEIPHEASGDRSGVENEHTQENGLRQGSVERDPFSQTKQMNPEKNGFTQSAYGLNAHSGSSGSDSESGFGSSSLNRIGKELMIYFLQFPEVGFEVLYDEIDKLKKCLHNEKLTYILERGIDSILQGIQEGQGRPSLRASDFPEIQEIHSYINAYLPLENEDKIEEHMKILISKIYKLEESNLISKVKSDAIRESLGSNTDSAKNLKELLEIRKAKRKKR